jgi:hypothetical protein
MVGVGDTMDIIDQIGVLTAAAGDLWFAAVCGAFFVMICEAAKPKAQENAEPEPQGFALLVMILSLLTPLLLLIHAVATGSGTVFAILALIGGIIVGSALIGWTIAAIAPDIGRTVNRAAPFLALAVFALTTAVTWQSAFGLINFLVTSFA